MVSAHSFYPCEWDIYFGGFICLLIFLLKTTCFDYYNVVTWEIRSFPTQRAYRLALCGMVVCLVSFLNNF